MIRSHTPYFLIILGVSLSCVMGAEYHVATTGDDGGPGSEAAPWRSVGRAVEAAMPGDTVMVHEGVYNERPTTLRGGGNQQSRIRFVADGQCVLNGWRIHHPYISLNGFQFSRHWNMSVLEAFIRCSAEGDFLEVDNCSIRDAAYLAATNVSFVSPNRILFPAGGVLDAGFEIGQTIQVNRASTQRLANDGGYIISGLAPGEIIVSGTSLVDDGPWPAVVAPVAPYGLVLLPGSESCVIRRCIFQNLAFDALFIMGSGHLMEDCLVERTNGWDALHFGGTNHVFRRNVFRNSPLLVYQTSPDAWENYSPVPYDNVLFTHNVVHGFVGAMSSQKGADTSNNLTIRRNVFIDVGRFNLTHPGTTFEHNTFLRVARQSVSGILSRSEHAITVNSAIGATGTTVRNNVFLDCGQPGVGQTDAGVGWYEVNGSLDGFTAVGNFAASGSPGFLQKDEWPESVASLNGGDPGLRNIELPFGADALALTADDGLRPLQGSKLLGAGWQGTTPGAYAPSAAQPPELSVVWRAEGSVDVVWPETDQVWALTRSSDLMGDWLPVAEQRTLQNGYWRVQVPAVLPRGFFRLSE